MKPEIRHHIQQNNKNLQTQQEIEDRLRSGKRVLKNSTRSKLFGTTSQKAMNPAIEEMYHVIVKRVKELYTQLPNKEDRVMIEFNNFEEDPTDSHGLFTIATPSLFFYLECDIKNNYRIEYLFHLCPLETEIQQLINQFSMRSYSTEVVKQSDYPTFFRNCLSLQPSRYIFQL